MDNTKFLKDALIKSIDNVQVRSIVTSVIELVLVIIYCAYYFFIKRQEWFEIPVSPKVARKLFEEIEKNDPQMILNLFGSTINMQNLIDKDQHKKLLEVNHHYIPDDQIIHVAQKQLDKFRIHVTKAIPNRTIIKTIQSYMENNPKPDDADDESKQFTVKEIPDLFDNGSNDQSQQQGNKLAKFFRELPKIIIRISKFFIILLQCKWFLHLVLILIVIILFIGVLGLVETGFVKTFMILMFISLCIEVWRNKTKKKLSSVIQPQIENLTNDYRDLKEFFLNAYENNDIIKNLRKLGRIDNITDTIYMFKFNVGVEINNFMSYYKKYFELYSQKDIAPDQQLELEKLTQNIQNEYKLVNANIQNKIVHDEFFEAIKQTLKSFRYKLYIIDLKYREFYMFYVITGLIGLIVKQLVYMIEQFSSIFKTNPYINMIVSMIIFTIILLIIINVYVAIAYNNDESTMQYLINVYVSGLALTYLLSSITLVFQRLYLQVEKKDEILYKMSTMIVMGSLFPCMLFIFMTQNPSKEPRVSASKIWITTLAVLVIFMALDMNDTSKILSAVSKPFGDAIKNIKLPFKFDVPFYVGKILIVLFGLMFMFFYPR